VWESILLSEADMDKHGVWDHVGGQAKALVRLLLQKEPGARPAANELLDHPWFASQLGAELTTLRRLLDKATSPTVVVRSWEIGTVSGKTADKTPPPPLPLFYLIAPIASAASLRPRSCINHLVDETPHASSTYEVRFIEPSSALSISRGFVVLLIACVDCNASIDQDIHKHTAMRAACKPGLRKSQAAANTWTPPELDSLKGSLPGDLGHADNCKQGKATLEQHGCKGHHPKVAWDEGNKKALATQKDTAA
jgi:hypothetical protein